MWVSRGGGTLIPPAHLELPSVAGDVPWASNSGEFGGAESWALARCVALGHRTSTGCLCQSWWDPASCWQRSGGLLLTAPAQE